MKEKKSLSISIFWIIVVFALDPGGYVNSYLSPIQKTFYTFGTLFIAFLIFHFHYQHSHLNILKFKPIKAYIIIIIIWTLYYLVVYYGFNNNEGFPGYFNMFLRNPAIFYKSFIVLPIAYFSIFSLNTFYRILIWSTIFIGSLFLITIFTGIPLMNTWSADRTGTGAKRNFMYGYGLMNYVIPLALTIVFFKFKLTKKVLIAALISFSIILITILRRDMIGVIEYVIIVSFLVSYIQRKHIIASIKKYLNFKYIVVMAIVLVFLNVFASGFVENTSNLMIKTLGSVGIIENKEIVSKTDQTRMSLTAQIGIVNAIKENFWIGTGFDSDWMTGDGGDKKWEGSDYVFLSALAMYGLVGLLIFLPFYILSFMLIRKFMRLARSNIKTIYRNKHYLGLPLVIGVAAASELIKNMIEYPNWFAPIGAITFSGKFFIFLGLLIGCYFNLKIKFINLKAYNGKKN